MISYFNGLCEVRWARSVWVENEWTNFPKNLTIAIVGGSRDEPELEIIKKYTNFEVKS